MLNALVAARASDQQRQDAEDDGEAAQGDRAAAEDVAPDVQHQKIEDVELLAGRGRRDRTDAGFEAGARAVVEGVTLVGPQALGRQMEKPETEPGDE